MSLLNASLLAGMGLIAVPIAIHLLMKRRPTPYSFPAIRFVQRRQALNDRRLNLRHRMLLALRCAAIALAALALARPAVASSAAAATVTSGGWFLAALFTGVLAAAAWARQASRPLFFALATTAIVSLCASLLYAYSAMSRGRGIVLGGEEEPVAAVVILDTAARMNYLHENRTRLAEAQAAGIALLRRLPSESKAAILDSTSGAAFAIDLAAAEKTLSRSEVGGSSIPLPVQLARAWELLKTAAPMRGEIYVLTDLTAAAWRTENPDQWRTAWLASDPPTTYLFDLGIAEPKNAGLGELRLSAESLPQGAELTIETELLSRGLSGERTIELIWEEPAPDLPVLRDGKLIVPSGVNRGSETLTATAETPVAVRFRMRAQTPGVHHGMVRIVGEDALAADDLRYFTLEVEETSPVLIVAPPGVQARDFAEAIAPEAQRDLGEARFACRVVRQEELDALSLAPFHAICLLDPRPLSGETWRRLGDYVSGGGGLALFLGPNAEPIRSFNEAEAIELLGARFGGKLAAPARAPRGEMFFEPKSLEHPLFAPLRSLGTSVPWERFPVMQYWPIDQLEASTRVVARFSNERPAVIERSFGKGRILTVATPACEPLDRPTRASWNELWAGDDAWPWFVFLNESLRYAAGAGEGKLNYLTGETAVLANPSDRYPSRYQLFTPRGDREEASVRDQRISVRAFDGPGAYRLKGNLGGPIARGFSANFSPDATELTRLDPASLKDLFGDATWKLARNVDELEREVGRGRTGQELTPFFFLLMVLALGIEYVFANRFYRDETAGESAAWNWKREAIAPAEAT